MKNILMLLLLVSISFAGFTFKQTEVVVKDIQEDGSVRIMEQIMFRIIGDSEKQLYENGITRNELSFWLNVTGITDIRMHVDTSKIHLEELRITPRPIDENRCNPLQKICHVIFKLSGLVG